MLEADLPILHATATPDTRPLTAVYCCQEQNTFCILPYKRLSTKLYHTEGTVVLHLTTPA